MKEIYHLSFVLNKGKFFIKYAIILSGLVINRLGELLKTIYFQLMLTFTTILQFIYVEKNLILSGLYLFNLSLIASATSK